MVERWQKENPEDNLVFRPYIQDKQTMLFVHQTSDQRHLLHRYGNELCSLDATYKTSKFTILVFFIVVKTNSSYQVNRTYKYIIHSSSSDTENEKECPAEIDAQDCCWNRLLKSKLNYYWSWVALEKVNRCLGIGLLLEFQFIIIRLQHHLSPCMREVLQSKKLL